MDRRKRREEIQKALRFIQSSLPFPQPQEYEVFLSQLVYNLFEEGNALYSESQFKLAVSQYSEAVGVNQYAQSEALPLPPEILEHLYVNRAAAHFRMGLYEKAVLDCDQALQLNEGSARALYRKTRALSELERDREAYECSTHCLLTAPHNDQVIALAQNLAQKLGLKIRRAYTRTPQSDFEAAVTNGETVTPAGEVASNGVESLEDIVSVSSGQWSVLRGQCIPAPLSTSIPVSDDRCCLSDDPCVTPGGVPFSVPESVDSAGGGGALEAELIGDELDNILDSIPKNQETSASGPIPTNLPSTVARLIPVFPRGVSPALPACPRLPSAFFPSGGGKMNSLDSFEAPGSAHSAPSVLDDLDSFSTASSLAGGVDVGPGLDSLSEFTAPLPTPASRTHTGSRTRINMNPSSGQQLSGSSRFPLALRNPLLSTHEFKAACPSCFIKTGPKAMDFTHNAEPHQCRRDVLLCRVRGVRDQSWKRVRVRPQRNNFLGAFVLCKEVLRKQQCQYGEGCTFAYCQEEIDVWTQERRGTLNRETLLRPSRGRSGGRGLTVSRLLATYHGVFLFLCEECFDSKPRIISKRSEDDLSVCSNLSAKHAFDENKCLVHALLSTSMRYSKLRPLNPRCQLDLCRHESRYGCQREDNCSFAHSLVELKTWDLQKHTGITHEEIVQESKRHGFKLELGNHRATPARLSGPAPLSGPALAPPPHSLPLSLRMKFVCGQCWRDGQVSEPDRALRYCTARSKHSWTRERRVLLVTSAERRTWVLVRPLPFSTTFPQRYDLCVHILKYRKCHYIGSCSFAHSPEERDVWTYMKDNNMRDMQQMYELWLRLTTQNRQADGTPLTSGGEEKQIVMPTDYAEDMAGFHCRVCGKHSNGSRQWQEHISTEKHKEKLFITQEEEEESEGACWKHRFPGESFTLCSKLQDGSCPEGVACSSAHSEEELVEWRERRDFLRRRLQRAREDMLVAPSDNDFGKYSFLLQD